MLPEMIRQRVIAELEGAPALYEHMLAETRRTGKPDVKPDPERFSIREVFAHVADFDAIFTQRIIEARDKDRPTMEGTNPGQMAIDGDYAHQCCGENVARIKESRPKLVAVLKKLTDEQWQRSVIHARFGELTIEAQAVMIETHDSYHLRQIAEWLTKGPQKNEAHSCCDGN